VLVLGAGVSGLAAMRLLTSLGDIVSIYDARSADDAGSGVLRHVGQWSDELLDGVDLVVTSPGFAPTAEPIVAARRRAVPVWGEIELAIRHLDAPVVAITGTNGKTTVTEMTSAMLTAAGKVAPAVGNIGMAPSALAGTQIDVLVMEVSSFQLYYTESLCPRVAVVLNVAPDHLDWHGSYEHYAAAKAKIFINQGPDDVVIYDADDPGAADLVASAPGRTVGVAADRLPAGGAGREGDGLIVPTGRIPISALAVDDPIFRVDLAAAAVAAAEMGADHPSIVEVATTFIPGVHRRTVVGRWDDVTWVNDSKASNPHAAVAAVAAYPSVVLIAGGRNKGLDLSGLVIAPSVRHVLAIGEAATDLLAVATHTPVEAMSSMAEAVRRAAEIARPGDTVLLSPGCASFDMFTSYGERGDVFTSEVHKLREAV
jgi:UDP-N-acetylmuramoylalanine--D-glutamate ligase